MVKGDHDSVCVTCGNSSDSCSCGKAGSSQHCFCYSDSCYCHVPMIGEPSISIVVQFYSFLYIIDSFPFNKSFRDSLSYGESDDTG